MQEIITNLISNYGYLAIFALIAIENIFPPIPSEIILTLGGFLVIQSSLQFPQVVFWATMGSTIGAFILYYVGYILQPAHFEKILRSPKAQKLGFKYEDIQKAQKWFDRNGKITVFLCRLVPVIRSLISIPAGMNKMPMLSFLFFTIIGSLLWNTILVYVGTILGENWAMISTYIDQYALIIAIAAIIAIIIYFYRKHQKKANKNLD